MARCRRATAGLALVVGLLVAGQGCLWAASPAGKQAEAEPPRPELTHEGQVSQDLIARFAKDCEVKREQQLFLAEQHFQTGKTHFELQDWKSARDHFEKAVRLNPLHAGAREHLRKACSMLGLEQGRFGSIMRDYMIQREVALKMQQNDLRNEFLEAKALFAKGRYREAIDAFTRVRAKATYLAPFVNAARTVEDAAACEQKARDGLERQRREDEKRRMQRAIDESRSLREQRQRLFATRNQARLEQARTLFDQRRYDQARGLCDAILRDDPADGAAADLREQATAARSDAVIDRAIAERRSETDLHMRMIGSLTTPQTRLVSMPRELLEQVKNRTGSVTLGGKEMEPEAWERQLREKLSSQKISFDFVETPLPDVLSFLGSLTDVSIILDPDTLMDESPTVTLRVNEMSLERALNWICKLVNLRYGLKNEAIYVAHPGKLRDRVVLRMYDVSDLTMEVKNFAGRQKALSTGEGHGDQRGGGGDGLEDFFPDDDEDDDEDRLTGDKLIEFIRRMIAPDSWERDDVEILEQPFGHLFDDDDNPRALGGRELVDIIGLTVGGHTWVGIRTRE